MTSPRTPSRVLPPNYFLGATTIPSDMEVATANAYSVRMRNQTLGNLVIDGGAYSSEFDTQIVSSPKGLTILLNWGIGQPNPYNQPFPFGTEYYYFDGIVSRNLYIFNYEVSRLSPSLGFPTLATCALWCREIKKMNAFTKRIEKREKRADTRLFPLARGRASPLSQYRFDSSQIEATNPKHSVSECDLEESDAKRPNQQSVEGANGEQDFDPDAHELR